MSQVRSVWTIGGRLSVHYRTSINACSLLQISQRCTVVGRGWRVVVQWRWRWWRWRCRGEEDGGRLLGQLRQVHGSQKRYVSPVSLYLSSWKLPHIVTSLKVWCSLSVPAGAANGANGANNNNNGKAAVIPPSPPTVTPNNSSTSSVKTVALPATPVVKVIGAVFTVGGRSFFYCRPFTHTKNLDKPLEERMSRSEVSNFLNSPARTHPTLLLLWNPKF